MKIHLLFTTVLSVLLITASGNINAENIAFRNSNEIAFIENKGQIADIKGQLHNDIKFRAHIPGANLYFREGGVEFNFLRFEELTEDELTEEQLYQLSIGNRASIFDKMYVFRVDLDFVNANKDLRIEGHKMGSVERNFYLDHCPDGILNVKEYFEITYKNLYDGIDLKFYSDNGHLKYDFIVHPGANPNNIKLRYNGVNNLEQLENGDVRIVNELGALYERQPYTYQNNGENVIESSFNISGNTISFDIGSYDVNSKLIIDPVIHWATYYNNNHSSDTWTRPVFSSDGSMFNAGYTYATAYPIVNPGAGAYIDPNKDGSVDLIIVKFDSDHALVWATYYGGNGNDIVAGHTDYGKSIAIDENDNLFVGGFVNNGATTFPTLDAGGGSFFQNQSKIHGETNFILKFNSSGVRLWATMFQHENANTNWSGMRINGIVAKGSKLYFTGQTYRSNNNDIPLRTLAGAYNNAVYVGDQDAFLGRFSSAGVLEWCTYLNSGNLSLKAWAQGVDLAVDNDGNLFYVGRESYVSGNQKHLLINPGGGAYHQATNAGDQDLTVTKFNSSMSAVWSTYYGGSDQDIPSMIETDHLGNVVIVCRAVRSTNWPCYDPGGGAYFQNTRAALGSGTDAGIIKFSNSGVRQWATYYGGGGTYMSGANTYDATTLLSGVGVDNANNLYFSGSTQSPTFPTQNQPGSYFSGTRNGESDAVFLKFNNNGVRQWATYYGGSGNEGLYSGKGAVYANDCEASLVAFGFSNSVNFPTVNPGGGAFYESTSLTTNTNVIYYFSEIAGSISSPPTSAMASPTNLCQGDTVTLSVVGGTLGSGAEWEWYSDSCGLNPVGTGATIDVVVNATTTYFVRAEGDCNTTACESVTVTVDASAFPPDSLTASVYSICAGDPVSLTVHGGALGVGGVWELYADSCGGTVILSNTTGTFGVSPSIGTTYYVLAAGICNTTGCESVTIDVSSNSVAPTSLSASPTSICQGDTVTLTVNGGALGLGAEWQLFDDACGGNLIANNTTGIFNVVPTVTTTYFVLADGSCNTTGCVQETVTFSPLPDNALSINGPASICEGDANITYSVDPINNASSYVWILPAGFTGSSTTNSIIVNIDSNATTGVIEVYGTNACGDGLSATLSVTINPLPTVTFDNTISPLCLNGLPLTLTGGLPSGGNYSGNGVNNNVFNPSASGVGIHIITYTYTDGNSCTNFETNTVEVLNTPIVSLDTFAYICANAEPFVLDGGMPSGGTYYGDFVNQNIFNPQTAGGGSYNIYYVYTDSITGCTDTASAIIYVVPEITLQSDLIDNTIYVDLGEVVNFTAIPGNSGTYNFYINESLMQSSTSNHFSTNALSNSSTVIVVLNNACRDSLEILIRPIPNAFTPLSVDGVNDVFMANVDLTIINRWGQELYKGKEGWDGTYKGTKVSPGTYYYKIVIPSASGEDLFFHGSVLVVEAN